MSDTKITSIDLNTISVAPNGYAETLGFAVTSGSVTVVDNDPEKTIINLDILSTARSGTWQITWNYNVFGTPPIQHNLYFKRDSVTKYTISSNISVPYRFDVTVFEPITNGISTNLKWTILETGSGGFSVTYSDNSFFGRWLHE